MFNIKSQIMTVEYDKNNPEEFANHHAKLGMVGWLLFDVVCSADKVIAKYNLILGDKK